jgi:putative hydrolase of the HAD superfamily
VRGTGGIVRGCTGQTGLDRVPANILDVVVEVSQITNAVVRITPSHISIFKNDVLWRAHGVPNSNCHSSTLHVKMNRMPPPLKVIFFDVGNTLLFPDRAHILTPLLQQKLSPSLEQWHAIERRTKKEFDAILQHNGKADQSFWYLFYSHLLKELGIHDDALRDDMVEATRVSANWCDIRPGTREILQRLGRHYRLAVISNADGKIADVLDRCRIADCFQTITDSGLVGWEKPHPAIFEAALRGMDAVPEQSLYVGDVYSVDYLGATRAGMQAILFDVSGAYRESGLTRVESLDELEQRV